MVITDETTFIRGSLRFSQIVGLLTVVTGLIVLSGWLLGIDEVKGLAPGLATMKFNTALCFVLTGIALWGMSRFETTKRTGLTTIVCAALTLAVSLPTLIEYITGINLGIDQLVVTDQATAPENYPGRMSRATTVNFIFLGSSLLLLIKNNRASVIVSQVLALLVTTAGLIGVEGYLLGTAALYSPFGFSTMALHTSVLFLLLGLGALLARPAAGLMATLTSAHMGGRMARRLIPVAVLLPFILGRLLLFGRDADLYEEKMKTAIFAALTVLLFVTLLWLSARYLNQAHAKLLRHNRALMEAERTNAHFAAIVTSSDDAIVSKDLDGIVTSWNKGACTTFGYEAEEMIGQPITRVIPPERQDEEKEILRRIRRGEQVAHFQTLRQRKDGRLIDISVTISPILNRDGQVIGASKIARDISERIQAEKTLARQAEELKRSNKDLEDFAYVASHDLQEPLRSVANCVQLLKKRYQGQLDERADEFIYHAVDGALRMQTLIQDLLDYSRVTSRKTKPGPVNLSQPLEAALMNLAAAIEESQAVVTHDPMPMVQGDGTQLTRIFQNLIGNAIKFRGDSTPAIHIGVEQREAEVVVSVEDNGIGIDQQYFERIFGIFQRLHTRKEYAGTGIGLAMCKRIVELHGGNIWVESGKDGGSTFFFSLRNAIC